MAQSHVEQETTYLVVGGGIAGVTCAEALAIYSPNESILLLTESSVVKIVSNLEPVARYLFKFDVLERSLDTQHPGLIGIHTLVDQLQYINSADHWVRTQGDILIKYRYLCLCTGGRPRLFTENDPHKRIIGIRDTDSVLELQRRLANANSVLIVGNGGIASELAYELRDIEVHWAVKDNHISSTFVDAGAAHFFQTALGTVCNVVEDSNKPNGAIKRLRYGEMLPNLGDQKRGAALGPDWHRNYALSGKKSKATNKTPIIHYKVNISKYKLVDKRLVVTLSSEDDAQRIESVICDFIVSATGVLPRHEYETDEPLKLAADGGIAINEMMKTNLPYVYAAGDVCTADWTSASHWFQMRLWTQARQMGAMAGRSMAAALHGEIIYQDFCFELFGHVTQLFGFSVVLLGRFNGQGLGHDYEILLRTTKAKEYIKFVLQNGRLRGAILIGNTELAETCENLILNEIDLTPFGDDILNPDIDIEDYFD